MANPIIMNVQMDLRLCLQRAQQIENKNRKMVLKLKLCLGAGSSCRVYRAINIESGKSVAVKQMIMEKQRSKQLTLNEICALQHLDSKNIIPISNVFYSYCELEGNIFLEKF